MTIDEYTELTQDNHDWCQWGGHTTALDDCFMVYAGIEGYKAVCQACYPECVGMDEEEEAEWRAA